jgi:rSAM/selenodomain-associated transferase 2
MKLSVIISTWCEADLIAEAVEAARRIGDEVIVADGGSTDGTADIARAAGARVVLAEKGRGPQLDAGARAATGHVLLFLHADARLPERARPSIAAALSDSEVHGGNFLLRFVPESRSARLFSWANDLRRRRLRIYYGDSAIFVRRDTYEALGGFAPMPIMEDFDLVRRLERHGRTAYITDVHVEVSARRFASARTAALLQWIMVQSLFSLGVPARYLVHLYPDARNPGPPC